MILREKTVEFLQNTSLFTKWALVLGTFALSMFFCYEAAIHNGNLGSSLLLFILPVTLSAIYFNTTMVIAFSGGSAVVSLTYLMLTDIPNWTPFLFFIAALGLNLYFWYRWNQERERQEFTFNNTLEETDLAANDIRIALGKDKAAYQANQIKIQRYTALNELARSLAMIYKTQEVVVLLIETISKTFLVPGGVYSLLLFDSSIGKALHAVRYSPDTEMDVRLNRERLNPQEAFNAWVTGQTKPLVVGDSSKDFRFQTLGSQTGVKSLVSAPLMAGSEMLGLIRMESGIPGVYRQEDARLLSNFADLGTVALEHVALYRQTIELAITDGLTGLYVQRYYKERLRDEVYRAQEHKLPLCLLMIDVDNFKTYNDRYGHLVGDRVLKVVSQVLKESVRTVDLVARYGGEEFSVLLLKTPLIGAQTVAERICQKVEEQEIIASQEATHITVSIGVAELAPAYKEVEKFIDAADQALYRAKGDGKNCVRLAKPGGLA
jgi:diguanylate cyclase (GGDEF)-like protein